MNTIPQVIFRVCYLFFTALWTVICLYLLGVRYQLISQFSWLSDSTAIAVLPFIGVATAISILIIKDYVLKNGKRLVLVCSFLVVSLLLAAL